MDSGKEKGIMTIVILLTPKHPAAKNRTDSNNQKNKETFYIFILLVLHQHIQN